MAFPGIVDAVTSSQPTNATTHTVTLPSGSGGMLLLAIAIDGGATVSGLTGWSQRVNVADPTGSDVRLYVFTRTTDPGGSSFNFTTASSQCTASRVWRINNANDVAAATAGHNGGSPNPPNLSPSWGAADTLWFALCAVNREDAVNEQITGFPSGFTSTGSEVSGNAADGTILGWGLREVNATSQDPGAFSLSSGDNRSSSATVAIQPSTSQNVSLGVIDAPATVFAPTIALSELFLSFDTVNAASNVLDISLVQLMFMGVISAPATVHAPTLVGDQATLAFDTIDASSTVLAPAFYHAVEVAYPIILASDDGQEYPGSSPTLGGDILTMIEPGPFAGFRFQAIQVPQGAIINNAFLSLVIPTSNKNDAEGTWYGQAADNPGTFVNVDGDIDLRPRTTSFVDWTDNDLGAVGDTMITPNLAEIVQEIVDRPGWSTGNSMVFFYGHDSASDLIHFAAFEHATYDPAELTIEYLSTVDFIEFATIDASATVHAPNMGAQILMDHISAPATVHTPTVTLDNQFVQFPTIDANSFVHDVRIVAHDDRVGLKITVRDFDTEVVLTDPDGAAAVQETFTGATFSEQGQYKVTFSEEDD